MKKNLLLLYLFMASLTLQAQVIAPSDPRIVTHTLSSGDVTIGISSNGGGYLNMIDLPGKGDIMDYATDMYGRGGQSAMRDRLHGGKYNPTQAGFNETIGTPSQIIQNKDSLVIQARQCALWHGDGKYDYIRWENIGADPYKNDNGNSDLDGIYEENLEGKQLAEVGSEFDYYGIYENYMGKDSVNIPCFRHYYEYRFIREPGHCLSQFGSGTPVFNSNMFSPDISHNFPEGVHPAGEDDISYLIKVWSLRNDISKWNPRFRHLLSAEGEWIVQDRDADLAGASIYGIGASYQPLVIIADSADIDKGLALGLYRPESQINTNVVVGVTDSTGEKNYEDNRTLVTRMLEQPKRAGNMSKYGFYLEARGLLNRKRIDSGIYEMVRSEFYILVGTPAEIMESAQKIKAFNLKQAPATEWHFTSDLEGWELVKNLNGEVRDGVLELEITGADPYMTSPSNLNLDANNLNQLIIDIRNGTNTSSGRIYWTTGSQSNFSASNSKNFVLTTNDQELRRYVINLSGHSGWWGTIQRIRLDPSNEANSGTVDIDYIGIKAASWTSSEIISDSHLTRIYPNPASEYIVVEHPRSSTISVYNHIGRKILNTYSAYHSCRLQINYWAPGLYLIKIESPDNTFTQKIIINKY